MIFSKVILSSPATNAFSKRGLYSSIPLIFLATDCESMLNYMLEKFQQKVIYYKCFRSKNEEPIQYNCKPESEFDCGGPSAGESALIDCLLLSKCNTIIHGISNLSACAAYLNPMAKLLYIHRK